MALGNILRGAARAGTAARLGHLQGQRQGEADYRERRREEREDARDTRALDQRDEAHDARVRNLMLSEALLSHRQQQAEEDAKRPRSPVLGTPEYLAAQEAIAEMRARHRPPPRPRQGETPEAEMRRSAVRVERQLGDTRSDLARTQRRYDQRPPYFETPADSLEHENMREVIERLAQRKDSLQGVHDDLIARVLRGAEGGSTERADFGGVQSGWSTTAPPGMTEELRKAASVRDRMLAQPGADPERIEELYRRKVAQIRTRHGAQ